MNLSGVEAVALSGTPANGAQASANPGQAVTLQGQGLSTETDVLLRYTDYSGNLEMVRLSPSDAAADGTSATLVVPEVANGAFTLQVLGSASQPLLQIVPVLESYDENGSLNLYGAGFVEGASTFTLSGASYVDTVINAGADISYYYDSVRGVYVYNGLATRPRRRCRATGWATRGSPRPGHLAVLDLNVMRVGSDTTALGPARRRGAQRCGRHVGGGRGQPWAPAAGEPGQRRGAAEHHDDGRLRHPVHHQLRRAAGAGPGDDAGGQQRAIGQPAGVQRLPQRGPGAGGEPGNRGRCLPA